MVGRYAQHSQRHVGGGTAQLQCHDGAQRRLQRRRRRAQHLAPRHAELGDRPADEAAVSHAGAHADCVAGEDAQAPQRRQGGVVSAGGRLRFVRRSGHHDDIRPAGRLEVIVRRDLRVEAFDRPRLLNVKHFARCDAPGGVDEPHRQAAAAPRELVRDGAAERIGPDDGDDWHSRYSSGRP